MGIKISSLPITTLPYSGNEQFPLVQSGVTKNGTLSSLVGYLSGSLLADSELAALSGNWQSTSTTFRANSANYALRNVNNFFTTSQSITGSDVDLTVGNSHNNNGILSVILGGGGNVTGPLVSNMAILGGSVNTVYAPNASVVGGNNNSATGGNSSVIGGNNNSVTGGESSILGGINHNISGQRCVIAGGSSNTVSNANAVVMGGNNNNASLAGNAIVGGRFNTTINTNATVVGGELNDASGARSSVMGGYDNTASGDDSTAVGGRENIASGNFSNVIGGALNRASGIESSVLGGRENIASGLDAVVLGGAQNTASGEDAVAMGFGAVSYEKGMHASSNGWFSFAGDAQSIDIPLIGSLSLVSSISNALCAVYVGSLYTRLIPPLQWTLRPNTISAGTIQVSVIATNSQLYAFDFNFATQTINGDRTTETATIRPYLNSRSDTLRFPRFLTPIPSQITPATMIYNPNRSVGITISAILTGVNVAGQRANEAGPLRCVARLTGVEYLSAAGGGGYYY